MDSKWSTSRKEEYRWVKNSSNPPLTTLQRPDGSLMANVKEMDSMVREAWSPIMRKYADTAELDAEAFMREYGRQPPAWR